MCDVSLYLWHSKIRYSGYSVQKYKQFSFLKSSSLQLGTFALDQPLLAFLKVDDVPDGLEILSKWSTTANDIIAVDLHLV
jgi:hypothetical protein